MSGTPAWVRRSEASPAGRRATGPAAAAAARGWALAPVAVGRLVVPPVGGCCQPRSTVDGLGAAGFGGSGLDHHSDGRTGTEPVICRRVGLTPVIDGREELGPAGTGLALEFLGLRMPPNDADADADAGLDASRRPDAVGAES
jgi:hypothetical protein